MTQKFYQTATATAVFQLPKSHGYTFVKDTLADSPLKISKRTEFSRGPHTIVLADVAYTARSANRNDIDRRLTKYLFGWFMYLTWCDIEKLEESA